ncbi:MAG: hypothetical protein MMC23_009392 [Stictis urceolatum]|nr:hypothetical protein [Stictis urceolata]
MAPSNIITKPVPQRTSSDSSAQITSPTMDSPRNSFSRTSSDCMHRPSFISRIRSSRSRSPAPRTPAANSPSEEKRLTFRTDSSLSTSSNSSPTQPQFIRSRSQKRNSGTTMQVGRHGNDWLFGGFSFTDAVKNLLASTEDRERD